MFKGDNTHSNQRKTRFIWPITGSRTEPAPLRVSRHAEMQTLKAAPGTLNRRLARLERRIKTLAGAGGHKDRDVVVAYVAIEALNAWTLFSRSFYMSCALGALTERKRFVSITPSAVGFGQDGYHFFGPVGASSPVAA